MSHTHEAWISNNKGWMNLVRRTRWHISGLQGLDYQHSYLITSNHQSWVDILVLQYVLNRRIQPLKFFLKQELIWVPVIGLAWWALGFPFMKRYSKAYLEKHPEKKGKDLETTRKTCAKFRDNPVGFSTSSKARASPKASMRSSNHPSNTCSSPRPAALPLCWMPWASSLSRSST
jgi:hypothetical protein